LQSLGLPDRDPTALGTTTDGYAVVATKQEVVVAKDLQRVSSFTPGYEPCMVAINQANRDVVIGGTVSVAGRVRHRKDLGEEELRGSVPAWHMGAGSGPEMCW